jgi:carbon storage regulator
MLVISRQPGDSLLIGDNIKITILEVSGDRIKIGIDAPRSVPVVRTEVLDTTRSNLEADQSGGSLSFKLTRQKLQPEPKNKPAEPKDRPPEPKDKQP